MDEAFNSYNSVNNNKLFNNKQFIEALYFNIKKELKRGISDHERTYIQNILRQGMPQLLVNKDPKDVLRYFVGFFLTKFKLNNSYDKIDIHELSKSQMGLTSDISVHDFGPQAAQKFVVDTTTTITGGTVSVTSLLGINDINQIFTKLALLSSGKLNLKKEYIALDSRYRSLDNDGTLYFKWNAIYDNSDIQGGFNINQRVRDVIAIKCYPIKMPYVSTADNDYGRITLLFQEFQSQAVVAHENTKYHYIFSTDIQDRWIHLRTHTQNEGIFEFATPLTQLSSLTVSFGSPLQPIVFDADRLTMNVSDYVTNNKTYFNSVARHNIETGDRVYISGFSSFNVSADNYIIGQVNNQYGNIATYVDDFTFYIDVNSSSMYVQGAGTITLTNGSTIVTGSGTSFISLFQIGDQLGVVIPISTVPNDFYTITSIISNVSLVISTPFTGTTGSYTYFRDNILPNLTTPIYFGSKRLLMTFQITYIDSGIDHA